MLNYTTPFSFANSRLLALPTSCIGKRACALTAQFFIVSLLGHLVACDRAKPGWVSSRVPSSIPNADIWLGAPGTAGELVIVEPGGTSPGTTSRLPLDIDCYIEDVISIKGDVYVSGVRSRGRKDSHGGIYQVNIQTGKTRMLLSTEKLGGNASSLCDIGKPRMFLAHGDGFVCRIDLDSNPHIIDARISIPSNASVAPLGASDVLVVSRELSNPTIYPMDGGPSRPIDGLPEQVVIYSISGGSSLFIGVSGHSTRLYTVTNGHVNPGKVVSINNLRGVLTGGFRLPGGNVVVVGSYEMPYHTFWFIDGARLNTPGMNVFGAARYDAVNP